jgi:hypothetical protein
MRGRIICGVRVSEGMVHARVSQTQVKFTYEKLRRYLLMLD